MAKPVLQPFKSEDSAALRTFKVPELLETILLQSSIKDLLVRILRVCKHWKATIESSGKIQRALFFRPVPIMVVEMSADDRLNGYRVEYDTWIGPVVENPFLQDLSNDCLTQFGGDSRMAKIFERPEASWRRMLLTQPPMPRVQLHSQWCGCKSLGWKCPSRVGQPSGWRPEDPVVRRLGQVVGTGLIPLHRGYWEKVEHTRIAGDIVAWLDSESSNDENLLS